MTLPVLVSAVATMLLAGCKPAPAPGPNTLPVRHPPTNGVLSLNAGNLRQLTVSSPFIYVGGQRFILRNSADAEQHLFVVVDAAKVVQRLYWIQIEELLPSESEPYDYSADSTVMVGGFALAANYRTYTTPPDSGSDRAAAFGYLQSRGYTIPEGGTRVRLVYLPESPARREVMIVYLESSPSAASESHAAFLSRALGSLVLRAR